MILVNNFLKSKPVQEKRLKVLGPQNVLIANCLRFQGCVFLSPTMIYCHEFCKVLGPTQTHVPSQSQTLTDTLTDTHKLTPILTHSQTLTDTLTDSTRTQIY